MSFQVQIVSSRRKIEIMYISHQMCFYIAYHRTKCYRENNMCLWLGGRVCVSENLSSLWIAPPPNGKRESERERVSERVSHQLHHLHISSASVNSYGYLVNACILF